MTGKYTEQVDYTAAAAVEREVVTALIVNDTVAARVSAAWGEPPGPFMGAAWNRVGWWAVEHHRKYGRAVRRGIRVHYDEWAAGRKSDEESRQIAALLEHISEDYARLKEDVNVPHVLDVAARQFRRNRIERAIARAGEDLEAGRLEDAEAKLTRYASVDLAGAQGSDLFIDKEAMTRTYAREVREPLIQYPGALGEFWGNTLAPKGFVSFMGVEKSGKSWLMLDVAYRAMTARKKVAYFQAGDLSEEQINDRLLVRHMGRPSSSTDEDGTTWPCSVNWPVSIEDPPPGEFDAVVAHETRSFDGPFQDEAGWQDRALLRTRRRTRSLKSFFRLKCYPTRSVTVLGIKAVIDSYILGGFVPDVVCVAEGSLVLTDRGLVPIERVSCNDRLWDGVSWVTHGGPVYKGVKDVISYAGLTATPDHEVWTDQGWRTLESCARMGLRVAQTGDRGRGVQLGEGYLADGPRPHLPDDEAGQGVHGQAGVRLCPMCAVRIGKVGDVRQHPTGSVAGVPCVQTTQAIPPVAVRQDAGRPESVPEPGASIVEALRRQGHRVPLLVGGGSLSVDSEQPGAGAAISGNRSHRQRRTLRTRQPSLVHAQTELFAHQEAAAGAPDAQVQDGLPACEVCGRYAPVVLQAGTVGGADRVTVVDFPVEVRRSVAPVWDIVNAGPLHRFTVQGLLAHNCIDYADILAPIDRREDPIHQIKTTWEALRNINLHYGFLLVTATQVNAESYKKRTLDRSNFGGNHLKYAEVTAMVGINMTTDEKERGVVRLNYLARRGAAYNQRRCVHVAGCLGLANPCVLSTYPKYHKPVKDES